MINVKFATNNGKVISLDELNMGTWEKRAMLSQLNQAKNLKQAEKVINRFLCYSSVKESIIAFIVWNKTMVLKGDSRQFRWIGDTLE